LNTCASACFFGSGSARSSSALVARCLDVDRRIALGRIGQERDDDVDQLADAGAGFRRREHHRDQMALAQRALERRVQLLGRDLALLEVGLHQLLVDLDHLVDQARCASSTDEKSASPEGAKKQSETLPHCRPAG
jgi:hypothetical protein